MIPGTTSLFFVKIKPLIRIKIVNLCYLLFLNPCGLLVIFHIYPYIVLIHSIIRYRDFMITDIKFTSILISKIYNMTLD